MLLYLTRKICFGAAFPGVNMVQTMMNLQGFKYGANYGAPAGFNRLWYACRGLNMVQTMVRLQGFKYGANYGAPAGV